MQVLGSRRYHGISPSRTTPTNQVLAFSSHNSKLVRDKAGKGSRKHETEDRVVMYTHVSGSNVPERRFEEAKARTGWDVPYSRGALAYF